MSIPIYRHQLHDRLIETSISINKIGRLKAINNQKKSHFLKTAYKMRLETQEKRNLKNIIIRV